MRNYYNHGRWAATFIQNTETGKYHCSINTENCGVIDFWDEYDWNSLALAVEMTTGIRILKRKDMHFEKISEFAKIATLDASGAKKGDCRVSLEEIRQGWKPLLPFDNAMAVVG